MSKMTPKPSITAKTVEAAVKRAAKGSTEEILDAACRGLALRLRGGAVTWTIRPLWDGTRKRFVLGDHTLPPDTARERALIVKRWCREGINPTPQVVQWNTGVPIYKQEARGPKSISWEAARKLFLDFIFEKRAEATYDDYKNILENTPELARFEGKAVARVTDYRHRGGLCGRSQAQRGPRRARAARRGVDVEPPVRAGKPREDRRLPRRYRARQGPRAQSAEAVGDR